jgi:hypothetical protein
MLEIITQRKIYNDEIHKNIISDVFINGKWFCYELEDQLRADGIKVDGETCVPADTYDVILTFSNHFQRVLPLIYNQPDFSILSHGKRFSGVRAHGGQTEADTHACFLTAYNVNKELTRIQGSAERDITALIKANGGKAIWKVEDHGLYMGGLDKKLVA